MQSKQKAFLVLGETRVYTQTVNSAIVIAAASVINNFIELWLPVLRFLFPFIA